jgi:dTDP-L-rhamnose 4-epimerase
VRVLVTGGCGFIGRHVGAALVAAGYEVVVLDSAAPGTGPLTDVTYVSGDVRDAAVCERALDGVDVVLHQAAKVGLGVDLDDLPDYASVNDVGTAVLLAAMARTGVQQLVLASSMVVYGEGRYTCRAHGDVPAPPRAVVDLDAGQFEPRCTQCGDALEPALVAEHAALDPRNAYAATKVAQEHLAAAWARGCGGSVAALRYHNVYGPGMPRDTPYAGVAAIFASALRRGEAPRVFEDGGQRRDFVHVHDVARANVAALRRLQRRQDRSSGLRAYNIGSGVPRTVGDLADALARAYGGPRPVVTGEYRLGDVRHVTASSARARAELDWSPLEDFTAGVAGLREGLGSAGWA